MTSTASPLSPSLPRRVFGAQPLHTDGDLVALAFAPDGTLWSVEEPGVLRQWDLVARQQLAWHTLDPATFWAFSPDARWVAGASDELVVWDVASGERVAGWPHPDWVDALAFSPDGTLLASGDDEGTVRLWDRARRQPARELRAHDRPVSALAFRADGRSLASAGEDKLIRLWDVATGEPAGTLAGHTDRVPALAWHPGGKRLISAGWDTTARVWDTAACEPVILLNSHASQVHALALRADGLRLACADSAQALHLWDLQAHTTLAVRRDLGSDARCLAFHPEGHLVAFGGADRLVRLWDTRRGADQDQPPDPLLSRTVISASPEGRLASLGAGTHLRVWDVATGRTALELAGNPVLRSFAASPDGRWFAASQAEGPGDEPSRATLGLWSARTGRQEAVLEGQAAPVTALAFAPDGTTLASAGFQGADVWLWRVPSGEPLLILPDGAGGCSVEALAFHPGGRLLAVAGIDYLATGGSDGEVGLWDVAERRQTASFPGGARALAFHPGGRLLAVASLSRGVRVWDLAEALSAHELIGHLDAVTCVAFSPDGRWLASGGDDRMVRIWDAGTGLQQGVLELDTQVKALAFGPDGRHLFTGNGNGSCYQLEVRRIVGR